MRITATLKGTPDSLGRRVIYIRINNGTKRSFTATKMKVAKNQFKKGKVINHPDAAVYNTAIKNKILETEMSFISGPVDKYPPVNFYKYCIHAIGQWEKIKTESTLKQYRGELSKIKNYKASFNLHEVTLDFLKGYLNYCLVDCDNTTNTAYKTFKFLRMIFAQANKERKIEHDPFLQFDMPKYKDPRKTYLIKDQIEKIASAELSDELRFIANWFLISCYTGLRFGDASAFDKSKHIKSGRLVIYTGKTGEMVSMPVSDKVKALLEHNKYKPLNFTNQYVNRALKEIIKKANIKQSVTFHASRHTFGTLAAEAGISQEVTARLMGHVSLKTTGIYYKITNPRIDAEIAKLYK